MFTKLRQLKNGLGLMGSFALLFAATGASADSSHSIDWAQIPLPACPTFKGGGDGHSPDPLTIFNQHVELADGEVYLLRGNVMLNTASLGRTKRKLQPYFNVDLQAHPWLANAARKSNPYYVIEGTAGYWRAFNGSYGELAARARVQFKTDADGEVRQVISLRVIPELTLIPRRE